MISINQDYTPSQDEKAENPRESRPGVIVVPSKIPQEVDYLTRRGSHFKPPRLMVDTLEERLENLPKVDQNPSMPNETTKEQETNITEPITQYNLPAISVKSQHLFLS
ncbi:hypothetical protein AMTR_s00021p00246170 [Amborella trichopoda]|uniref:Uncharacterized protein n=1 Tax=Amborella trichopoda TaxID=13333 RepID=W1PVS1_AMBTC|nr:hypothetical protein AMTR_s00021p00246170 [Amborella trichopoda]